MTNPADLTGDEFHDWISKNLNYKNDWSTLLVAAHLPRTVDSVEGLIDSLERQLDEHLGKDETWDRRTKNMLKMAEGRLRQTERHAGSGTRQLSAVKDFAAELCEIIEDSDLSAELDLTDFPFGDITAREWLARRREKRGEVAA